MIRISLLASIAFLALIASIVTPARAVTYSSGNYGACAYETCSISLVSGATVAVNVTPSASATTCSVQSNTVTATTDSSTGYTVTVNNSDTNSILNGSGGNTIPSINGTPASPASLTANTWGYRVDGISGFGTGPTSALSNGAVPSVLFASIPSSAAPGGVVRNTSTADGGTVNTPVWYGVCANVSKPTGTYTDAIVYTAVIN